MSVRWGSYYLILPLFLSCLLLYSPSIMATPLDSKDLVTLDELTISNMWEMAAVSGRSVMLNRQGGVSLTF